MLKTYGLMRWSTPVRLLTPLGSQTEAGCFGVRCLALGALGVGVWSVVYWGFCVGVWCLAFWRLVFDIWRLVFEAHQTKCSRMVDAATRFQT